MAAAEAPLRISIFSISSARRSAIRLDGLSWLDVVAPLARADVTTFNPAEVEVLSTKTPSTTYKGCVLPYTEVTPRSFTEIPPPGAPELALIYAPEIFPSRAASKVCAGETPFNSLDVIVATAFDKFLLLTDVVNPVTTISSSLATSSVNVTCRSEAFSVLTVCVLKPAALIN